MTDGITRVPGTLTKRQKIDRHRTKTFGRWTVADFEASKAGKTPNALARIDEIVDEMEEAGAEQFADLFPGGREYLDRIDAANVALGLADRMKATGAQTLGELVTEGGGAA